MILVIMCNPSQSATNNSKPLHLQTATGKEDAMSFENIVKIKNTPLSISVYAVKDKPLNMHEAGTLEIIFCLTGTIKFAYAYEEFTLNAGEYVSVDRDAYYLYSDGYNMCVSFYVDLMAFKQKYPNIEHQLFVCEGCSETTTKYMAPYHDRLRGKLITLLKIVLDGNPADSAERITAITESIVDLFIFHFNIAIYHYGRNEMPEDVLERVQQIYAYIGTHFENKITLEELAAHLGLSSSYLSEFMRTFSIGFRRMLAYIRANKSEWYLINTDHTIVEISELCGFSDPQYYYRAFKEWYKSTPKQFREKYVKHQADSTVYYEPHVVRSIVDDLLVKHYIAMFEN